MTYSVTVTTPSLVNLFGFVRFVYLKSRETIIIKHYIVRICVTEKNLVIAAGS